MFVKQILDDLKVSFTLPINLLCNIESLLFSALDLIQHGRMKHVDMDKHFIKQKISMICNFFHSNIGTMSKYSY